jgi:hypothetical protein
MQSWLTPPWNHAKRGKCLKHPVFMGVPVAMAEGGAVPVTKSAACRPCRIATSVPHLLVFALRNPNNSD